MVKKPEKEMTTGSDREPVLVALGVRVRELRTAAGMSQRKFAEAAGVSHPYMVTVEAGVPNVSVVLLDKMAKVLGVSIAAFFETGDSATKNMDPVLSKIASELYRVANGLESRRDAIGELIAELEKRLGKSA
ncbi:hypothetical protein MPC4_110098 [Methylocella tundrae]|uniref:HTH cro/C1-type domain-containing protein n=1 Tax=Methylocella tundrae TaxID=227605 RepID=A0A8B6M1T7_METTU|nr:helix-turn-helix domain-containing protein [Methylocella tundrae]VTZ27711.1 hypothetical protein MPC1_6360004 [Methylocella tundrae]VTZ48798.1 hypothetical protein MPC4_110098 [Methylocella tundrae]